MSIKKIRFFTGHDSSEVNEYYLNLTPNGKGVFQNCQFFFNEDIKDYDYVVVFEELYEKIDVSIPMDRVIFVAAEATSIKIYDQKFLDQFGHVITCQKGIQHRSKYLKSPGHSWFSKKSYDELMNITDVAKTKSLSIVASNKTFTKGHKDRFEFCLRLKEHLGDKVDLFGRGFNEFDDKWSVIAPYKYSIAIENSIEQDWVTEKLGDCYTSHTFPFYMGAPNVGNYFNSKSYELIDISDFEKSLRTITRIIDNPDHYNNHLAFLTEAKHAYLNKHSVIPMICDFINGELSKTKCNSTNKELIIFPEKPNLFRKTKKWFLTPWN